MGRKKKNEGDSEKEKNPGLSEVLHSDAKRSIAAVILIGLAVLCVLGFAGAAGRFGELIDSGVGVVLGYGKWLFPLVLLLGGLMFFERRESPLADAVKFIGLFLAFLTLLSIFHLYSGDDTKELLRAAKRGEGGGFLGFGVSALLLEFTGRIAGTIVLTMLFLVGVIAAFNVSLMRAFERMRHGFTGGMDVPENETVPEEGTTLHGVSSLLDPDAGNLGQPTDSSSDPTASPESSFEENIRNISFHGEQGDTTLSSAEGASLSSGAGNAVASIPPSRPKRRRGTYRWALPPTDLLELSSGQGGGGDVERNKHVIQSTLKYFGIDVEPGEVKVGPTVTQYTFRPGIGVKLSRITTLSNDLSLALARHPIRIEAPIPGESLIGIEVPNVHIAKVKLRKLLESREFRSRKTNLSLILGENVSGKPVIADLKKMPHLLIAGRTGSGKSVCINALLLSLLYQNSPEDLRLILVDPKRVELSSYNGIPHLRTDVVVENKKVINMLRWLVGEMERRQHLLGDIGARDITAYQERVRQGETRIVEDPRTHLEREEPLESLPQIVLVIDEMAELMIAHGKEVEPLIVRLAQMSRAFGIHLILATQRPEVTVITGLIKANIPARISFHVKSQIDSRTILDTGGAEKLLGSGDMLYATSEGAEMWRVQGAFVTDAEVHGVTDFLRKQKKEIGEEYFEGDEEIVEGASSGGSTSSSSAEFDEGGGDELYDRVKELVMQTGRASTTSLQTAFKMGYPKAARLMHLLEENGVVGRDASGKKVVLMRTDGAPPVAVSAEDGGEQADKKWGDDPLSDQSARERWQP